MPACTFDPQTLTEMFGDDDARELFRLALGDLRGRLARLRESLATGDAAGAARAAHSIAGVSGNITADTLCDLARELEAALIGCEAPSPTLVSRVHDESAVVLSRIAWWLDAQDPERTAAAPRTGS